MLHKFAIDLGADGITDELSAARALHKSGSEMVKDKEGKETPRALGGIFIRLCKKKISEQLHVPSNLS